MSGLKNRFLAYYLEAIKTLEFGAWASGRTGSAMKDSLAMLQHYEANSGTDVDVESRCRLWALPGCCAVLLR